jgi:molecular chaperone IbpA
MRNFDLTPLFRSTVGFDRLNDLFQNAARDETTSTYPPYNIAKVNEDHYYITMAVAGFSRADVNIILQKNLLTISGQAQEIANDDETQLTYLYKGIANRAFERKFNLAEHMKVVGAKLNDGLLTVELVREIPEEIKPKQIAITS